jgi:hypothetical protein
VLGRLALVLVVTGLMSTSCGNPFHHDTDADRRTPPELGACRALEAADLDQPSNASPVVPCSKDHTAQTFAVGTLPATTGSSYQDKRHGTFVFDTCTKALRDFLGADESLVMRIQLSWAWFRPSERGWEDGARWYRCDVVGGADGAKKLRHLPTRTKGLFSSDLPDAWLTCARGATVARSTKVPCSESHDWRAVSTIKVGQPQDPYPGDRIVQVRSRDRCSDWVGAWMHYPPDYDYGYSWFHEAEWATGNRRSVCWARTDQ